MKKYNPYVGHQDHQTEICGTYKVNGYYYRCIDCDKFVGWLSKAEVARGRDLDILPKPAPTWAQQRKMMQNGRS